MNGFDLLMKDTCRFITSVTYVQSSTFTSLIGNHGKGDNQSYLMDYLATLARSNLTK